MQSVSPVVPGLEEFEKIIALEQSEYFPICVLYASNMPGAPMVVRFRPTDEQRAKIAAGADLVLSQLTFKGGFAPVNFQVCDPDETPRLITA